MNIRGDGKLEVFRPILPQREKITKRIESTDKEKFDLLLETTPAKGKEIKGKTRASLVSKRDFGC